MHFRSKQSVGGSGCISVVLVGAVITAVLYFGPKAFSMGSTQFGTYTQAYLDRKDAKRWKELCKGGGRYQAMAEAYDKGKPSPCR